MRFLEDPGVRLAKIDGNPFHETVREIARRAGLVFCLNVVTDDRERVVAVAAGDPDAVFATSDGIWPLFFATLDRSRAGSLWNGCYHVRRGRVIRRYYFFFTEADPQNEGVWRNGTIYVVPSNAFARTWIPNEWG